MHYKRTEGTALPLQQTGLTQSGTRTLLAVLALYFLCVIGQSTLKLVWGDELFTLYIARTGSMRGIWHALAAGSDPNPPLIHASVLLSTRLFGMSASAIRLPSILYVGIALVSMWSILRRWVTPDFAALGLLAFMATRGFDYSYDARSYAPMMGSAMLSLALWFAASDRKEFTRTGLLVLMALALAAGLFSNYYCVLAFFPIAAGQGTLDLRRRGVSWMAWIMLALAALPLLALLPLIRHNISEFAPHAWNRAQASVISLSYFELVEGILWPVLLVTALAVRRGPRTLGLPPPALAAMVTLLLYPLLGYAIAVGGAGMISPRCVAPVCCGVGLLAGVASSQVFAQNRRGIRIALAVLVLWVAGRESFCASLLLRQRHAFFALRDRTAELDRERPILVADSSLVLPLYFYSSPQVASRILFPIDFEAIHRLQADDSGEQNLWAGRYGVFPFPIVAFRPSFAHGEALVVARPDGWLANSLGQAGGVLRPTAAMPAWDRVGGVFSPMAHPETRFLFLNQ